MFRKTLALTALLTALTPVAVSQAAPHPYGRNIASRVETASPYRHVLERVEVMPLRAR